MLQIHASLGTFCVSLVFPRSHNKLQFRWLLRPGQSQRFLSKIYFHFASVFGNIIDLGKRIHTLTMGTGHVIKNSLISPQQNSIPSKLASYTILSFTKSNENWRARFQLVRKNSRYECSLFQPAIAWLLFKEPLQATRDREKVLGVLSLKSIQTGRFDILHVHASNRLRCKRIQRYSCIQTSQIVLRLSIIIKTIGHAWSVWISGMLL